LAGPGGVGGYVHKTADVQQAAKDSLSNGGLKSHKRPGKVTAILENICKASKLTRVMLGTLS